MRDRMMQFFEYDHLPAHLQAISKPFADLAEHIDVSLPSNPERSVALRKLLDARASVFSAARNVAKRTAPSARSSKATYPEGCAPICPRCESTDRSRRHLVQYDPAEASPDEMLPCQDSWHTPHAELLPKPPTARERELEAALKKVQQENERLADFIAREGYRRCDIPACNCNSFHGGHSVPPDPDVTALREAFRAGFMAHLVAPDPAETDPLKILDERNRWRFDGNQIAGDKEPMAFEAWTRQSAALTATEDTPHE